MAEAVRAHPTRIELADPAPDQIAVGSRIKSRFIVICEAGCYLDGAHVISKPPDGLEAKYQLVAEQADPGASAVIGFEAPRTVGESMWRIEFPVQTSAGIPHEESAISIPITTRPHHSSLAVWNLPPSAVAGTPFFIRVGAKSAADANLSGHTVQICDQTGAVVGSGALKATPWPGTSGLYWTDAEVLAPKEEGICAWSVRYEPTTLELAHENASSPFQVAVVRPPEHTITIKLRDIDTAAAIDNAQVRVGAYRAVTDAEGVVEVRVAKGQYAVAIWKAGHEAPVETVHVDRDLAIEIAVLTLPKEDPDAAWTM